MPAPRLHPHMISLFLCLAKEATIQLKSLESPLRNVRIADCKNYYFGGLFCTQFLLISIQPGNGIPAVWLCPKFRPFFPHQKMYLGRSPSLK